MAKLPFQTGDGNVSAEDVCDGDGLFTVACDRAGRMGGNLVDILWRQPRVVQSEPHAMIDGGMIRLADLRSSAIGGVADDFRKWLRMTCFRMFQRFDEEHARTVAADKAATVRVKRPRKLLDGNAWLFGQCMEEAEGFDDDGSRLIATASDERILLAKLELLIGEANGL